MRVNAGSEVRIFGSEGSLSLAVPFTPQAGESHGIVVKRHGEPETRMTFADNASDLYALEADTVARYIEERQAPVMSWNDTLGNMRLLDQWRAALGVVYDAELPQGQTLPLRLLSG